MCKNKDLGTHLFGQVGGAQLLGGSCGQLLEAGNENGSVSMGFYSNDFEYQWVFIFNGFLFERKQFLVLFFFVGTPFYSKHLVSVVDHADDDDDGDDEDEDEDDGDDEDEEDEDDDHDLRLNPCSATEVPIHWVHAFEHHRRNGSSLDG
jgi:hypothetical protein